MTGFSFENIKHRNDVVTFASAFTSGDPKRRVDGQRTLLDIQSQQGLEAEQILRAHILCHYLDYHTSLGREWWEESIQEILQAPDISRSFLKETFDRAQGSGIFKQPFDTQNAQHAHAAARLLNIALRTHCTPVLKAASTPLRLSFETIDPFAVAISTDIPSTGSDFKETLLFLRTIEPAAPAQIKFPQTLRAKKAASTPPSKAVHFAQAIDFLGRTPGIHDWPNKLVVMAEAGAPLSIGKKSGDTRLRNVSVDKNLSEWIASTVSCQYLQREASKTPAKLTPSKIEVYRDKWKRFLERCHIE